MKVGWEEGSPATLNPSAPQWDSSARQPAPPLRPQDPFKCCSWPIYLPAPGEGHAILISMALGSLSWNERHPTPAEAKLAEQQWGQEGVDQGRASSRSPGLPHTARAAGQDVDTMQGLPAGPVYPTERISPRDGYHKSWSILNGRNIKALLAGMKTAGTIYSRRAFSLRDEDVLDSRTHCLALPMLLPLPPPRQPGAALPAPWRWETHSREASSEESALHNSPPGRLPP